MTIKQSCRNDMPKQTSRSHS